MEGHTHCTLCDMSFDRHPADVDSVMIHLKTQCPVTFHILQLIESCDGWPHGVGPFGVQPMDGELPRNGSAAPREQRLESDVDAGSVHPQTPAGRRTPKRQKRGPDGGCAEGSHSDGPTSVEARDGHGFLEGAGQLHPPLGPGCEGIDALASPSQCQMERGSDQQDFCPGSASTENPFGQDDLHRDGGALHQSYELQAGRSFDCQAHQGTDPPSRPELAVTTVGWQSVDPTSLHAQHQDGHDGQMSGGCGRAPHQPIGCDPLQLPANHVFEQNLDVEIAGPSDECGLTSAAAWPGAQLGLDLGGCTISDTSSQAQLAGDTTGCHSPPPFLQGQGQGEGEEGEDTGLHRRPGSHSRIPTSEAAQELKRQEFQQLLQRIVRGNNSVWCYANSAVTLTLWTCCDILHFDVDTLHVWGQPIASIFQELQDELGVVYLVNCRWFNALMGGWAGGSGQADASELVQLLLDTLVPTEVNLSWEKRLLVTKNGKEVADRIDSGTCSGPLIFQLPSDICDDHSISLQALIQHWCKDWNMTTALTAPTQAVFVQIDRIRKVGGTPVKCHAAVVDCERCIMPVFSAGRHNGTTELDTAVRSFDYILVGAIVHGGHMGGGHYQTILRMGPYDSTTSGKWVIQDDNQGIQDLEDWTLQLAQSIAVLSFVRADVLSLPVALPPDAQTDPYQLVDEVDLLTMLTQ